jgi:hypothetical protein
VGVEEGKWGLWKKVVDLAGGINEVQCKTKNRMGIVFERTLPLTHLKVSC